MPVTIGEFEVITEPPATPPAVEPTEPATTVPDPLLLQRLLAELHEQALRLWAH